MTSIILAWDHLKIIESSCKSLRTLQHPVVHAASLCLNHSNSFSRYCASLARENYKELKIHVIFLFSDVPVWYFNEGLKP